MKTYIINLDKYIDNYNSQKPYLEKLGLNINRVSAINAIENEHLKYSSLIPEYINIFIPKSIIGCFLSHLLVCKEIVKNNEKISLIMEDDAYPLYEKDKFYEILNKTINDIEILNPKWDIIQLHSDALFPTPETYSTHCFCGSTAAYLISLNGAKKMAKEKVGWHLDVHTSANFNYYKYRVKNNLFMTKENFSLNRNFNNSYITNIKSIILSQLIPLRGEKTWKDFLNFKMIKILDKDITANHLTNLLILLFIIKNIKISKILKVL